MTGVASALFTVASILGIWTAVSLVSTPVLVLCLRSQARVNARRTGQVRREAWSEWTRSC